MWCRREARPTSPDSACFIPQAWAYRIDQQWKELNFGPLQIFFCLLLFNGELRQLAAAANPNPTNPRPLTLTPILTRTPTLPR